MSQNCMILNHLEQRGGITQAEAVELYGCYRLSARISDLKRMGHSIDREMISVKNRYGDTTRVARYRKAPPVEEEPTAQSK